jgi:hypothetical protein
MSAASRLTPFMGRPDGINPAQALAAASANLEAYRETALALVDKAIAELAEGAASVPHEEIERLADSIAALAGMFGEDGVTHAAKRLCETVRGMVASRAWEQTTIDVHVAALRVIRARAGTQDVAQLLAGLDRLAARKVREVG